MERFQRSRITIPDGRDLARSIDFESHQVIRPRTKVSCGVLDPDCADGTVASCDYCDDPGSCSAASCPGDIDPTQNWFCQEWMLP